MQTETFRPGNVAASNLDRLTGGSYEADPSELLRGAAQRSAGVPFGDGIRVKKPSERYSTEKSLARHRKFPDLELKTHGVAGAPLKTISELEYAQIGAWWRSFLLGSQGHQFVPGDDARLSDHEAALVRELRENQLWVRSLEKESHIGGFKTLLDESGGSGGLEIVPVVFDEAIVNFPLIHSEIFPFVTVKDVTSRRVEGASISNVTLSSLTEGSTASEFDTDGLIAALDTTVFDVGIYITVGRNLLADSPVDVGQELMSRVGQRYMNYLDVQVVNGDGTTEPQGILNASGISTVAATNSSTSGPLAIDDALNLYFGVSKVYRRTNASGYIMTDTSYQRFRSLATGITSDDTLLFGQNLSNYALFGDQFANVRIEDSEMGNGNLIYGDLSRYRVYRRQGMTFERSTGGRTLMLDNEMLISGRARVGGRVMDSSAFVVMNDAQV